ncbi:uncharacterized protein LOC132714871 [Ruditapes philippinarum]|uniref:uncharacterized protein LOC132714871 n=1 Tax=Ruditapes philippinarum TaxID=129788 RepID=UPI00295B6705|nr:uncharacterized protein LOC132714871 [Ruditapes philippinarum]
MAFSSRFGGICLRIVQCGTYFPLFFAFEGKYFVYLFTLHMISFYGATKLLPKSTAFENSLILNSLSFVFSCLLWYYILDVGIDFSIFLGLFILYFQFILIPSVCSWFQQVIEKIQLWIKLQNDILQCHAAWKKYLFYGIWALNMVCTLSTFIYIIYTLFNAVNYFYKDHGLKEINIHEIEKNDCIPYTSFPDQLWFSGSDLEESVNVYYMNDSISYIGDRLIILESISKSMKENSKLCKTFIGEDFLVTFDISRDQYSAYQNMEYYWSFNGTRIFENSFGKYTYWHTTSERTLSFHFLVKVTDYKDAGMYVLHRKTTENYSLRGKKIKYQMLRKDFKQFIDVEQNVVERKVLKFCLILFEYPLVAKRDVGTLVTINNFFKISTFRFHGLKMKPVYLINGRDVRDVCPLESSCNPTVSFHHNRNLFKLTSEVKNHSSILRVNVSFCVCPKAYGIHEFYFVFDDAFEVKFPLSLTLKPPDEVLQSSFFLAMLECCRSGSIYIDPFDIIMDSYMKQNVFYSKMEERFIQQKNLEHLYIVCMLAFSLFAAIIVYKMQRILLYCFFTEQKIECSEDKIYVPKCDIFISYCDEDQDVAEKLFLPFMCDLGYKVHTYSDIPGNMDTRYALKEYIRTCKVFILILSENYLNDNLYFKLQYEMTILMSVAESIIEHENILVIRSDNCRKDADPLKRFRYIDWTNTLLNLRSDEEKKDELRIWLTKRLRPNVVWLFVSNWLIKPCLCAIRWVYYANL